MQPDIIINVRFIPKSEGGRDGAVQGETYSCPLFVNGDGFDCRLLLNGRCLELGEFYEVPVKFLYRDKAMPNMKPGLEIFLWEGRSVAQGIITEVLNK